ENVHIKDLKIADTINIQSDLDQIVVSVVPPTKVEEKPAEEIEETPTEPELVGKEKEEEKSDESSKK
ncbi:50S ribosomal protein L25/general stress protein Ctc, partial [bacterium]